jgi:hypothetical protein
MFIPAGSELNSRIVVKRKDAASVESWDDIDLYDKVCGNVLDSENSSHLFLIRCW